MGSSEVVVTGGRNLQETPTWALAGVCFIFITLSLFAEHLIHLFSTWLKKRRKTALYEAVEKLKSVLMLLGFMSLILTVTQKPISRICIPKKFAFKMLPCRKSADSIKDKEDFQERILEDDTDTETKTKSDYCESKDMVSLISEEGINQLAYFLFALAAMQVIYSLATVALGRAKMRRWKAWEKETTTVEYLAANDPNRFRITRETTFGRRHSSSETDPWIKLWTICFFRQFFHSIVKVDYITLRHGFIAAHLSGNNSFDFQKYIQRSLDDDFKSVVGISPLMWVIAVIFMLVDVHGWEVYLWISFLPLVIVLVVGTKLGVIVEKLAIKIIDQKDVILGSPLVQPNDSYFWFGQPQFVLTLLHYTLFMNAFELAFFIWVTFVFGIDSCYHRHLPVIIIRVMLALIIQFLCGYITLPLYALVTQMGSQFKRAVLEEQSAKAIRQWHAGVRHKRKKHNQDSRSTTPDNSVRALSSTDISSHHRSAVLEKNHEISDNTDEENQDVRNRVVSSDEIEVEQPGMTRNPTLSHYS